MIVRELDFIAGQIGQRRDRVAQVEDEDLRLELADHVAHPVVLDDPAFIDDRDVAAEIFRFLEIVSRENDGRAAGIDGAQEVPHRATNLDVDPGGRLIQDQQARLVHQRSRDHQAALHATGQRARHRTTPFPELQLLEILLCPLRARARAAGHRSPPG